MDTLYGLLKVISLIATGAFGVLGLLTKYKDDKGLTTKWGKLAIGGILVSSAISFGMYFLETSKAKAAAEKAKSEAEATRQHLLGLQRNAERVAEQQKKSLEEAEVLRLGLAKSLEKSDDIATLLDAAVSKLDKNAQSTLTIKSGLQKALEKSDDIAINLGAAVTKLDKNNETTSTILAAEVNKLSFLQVTLILAADALSFGDEKGRSILSETAQRLLLKDAQAGLDPVFGPWAVTAELQQHQLRVRELVFAGWYFRFFLFKAKPGMSPNLEIFTGQVYDRQGEFGLSNFTISSFPPPKQLGFGEHSSNRAIELRVTYAIPPDHMAGYRTYQDLNDKTWAVHLIADPKRVRLKSVLLQPNGTLAGKYSQMSTEEGNLKVGSLVRGSMFYEGRVSIPPNFYAR